MRKSTSNFQRINTFLDYAYSLQYKERPVSMKEFLCDDRFFGKLTGNGKMVYPVWMKVLDDISKEDSKYIVVLTGGIGTGKSRATIWGMGYVMHRILCIAGYSTIYDCEKKKWIAIASAYKNGLNYTLAVDEEGNVGAHKVDHVISSGRKSVYEISIKSSEGRFKKIRTSLDHKFWTKKGWVPLKDISVGDEVLIYGDNLLLTKEEKFKIHSESTKKVWATRTKEERYRICKNGLDKLNSPEILAKSLKNRGSEKSRKKLSNSRKRFFASLFSEERKEITKHLHEDTVREKARAGLIKYWHNISLEEKDKRVSNWLDSMDWSKWREAMRLKVWDDKKRNERLGQSIRKYMLSLSKEELKRRIDFLHTPEAIVRGVLKRKEWWNSLTQNEKNLIVQKQLETKKKNGDFNSRAYWGYGKRTEAIDGHICDSKYEASIDDWLTNHSIEHDIHVIIKNGGLVKSIDFLSHGWYIEADGLSRPDSFFENKLRGLPYVVVRPEDDLNEKLGFLVKNTNSNFSKTLFGEVVSIEPKGEKLTYDIVMADGSPKNFICGGIVVHNCLKDPWSFFKKAGGGKMAIVFFNLTKSLGASRGYNLLQSHLLESSWFKERGTVIGSGLTPRIEFPIFEFKLASPYSKGFGTVGSDVILADMDEVDDSSESEKQRLRVLKAYDATVRRFINRFVYDEESIGKFFLVASKQEQMSFLNTFIVEMKSAPCIYIVDIPIWEAKPKTDYSGKKFPVMLGDLYVPSKVLGYREENEIFYHQEEIEKVQAEGYKILWVPVEYFEDFHRDIVGALRDIAGVSVSYMRKSKLFPSEKLLVDCYDSTKKDPITRLTVEVGLESDVDLINYFNLDAIRIPRNVPRYMHVDIAFSGDGDALGLAMSCVKGWKTENIELEDGTFTTTKLSIVETDFVLRLRAPAGDKIPLNKVRKLIIDLKKKYHFNIVLCTFDHRSMSEDSIQILENAGVNCGYFSVDKDPNMYRGFRDLVKEDRWITHRNEFLNFELVNLEDDLEKNKIDHPDKVVDIEIRDGETREIVLMGSKDMADAVCGSVNNALKNSMVPPDIEFMKNAISKSMTVVNKTDHPAKEFTESFFNAKSPEVEAEKIDKTDIQSFKDIFKKTQM